jgi:glycosyltransferase involved in cell wall biosynthesis
LKRVRVAHICTVDLSLRYLLANQLKFLQEQGYDVVGISNPGPDVPWLQGRGIKHIAVPMTRNFTPWADLKSTFNLMQVLQRGRFDIVHTHNPKPGLIGQIAARAAGVPIVVNTLHGFYFHDHMPEGWRRFYIAMEKIAAGQSSAILSQNPEDVATAIREGICGEEAIRLLGNGIDLKRFDPESLDDEEQNALKQELGIQEGDVVLGFVGRLVAEKGIHELFQAAAGLKKEFPRLKLLVVGPTDDEKSDALKPADLMAQHGLEQTCIFTGMRQDMPQLYGLMDVFVLPSHREGYPRSPQEAAAMKVPSVVTDIRGCRETVVGGETGHFFPLKDVPGLISALRTLLGDEGKRQEMGAFARELALRKFDERDVFEKVAQTYARELAKTGSMPPDPRAQAQRKKAGPNLYAA